MRPGEIAVVDDDDGIVYDQSDQHDHRHQGEYIDGGIGEKEGQEDRDHGQGKREHDHSWIAV